MDNLGLVVIWKQKNGFKRDTYFSERHKSFSRIDMVLILRDLVTKISKVEILPKIFSDRNSVSLIYKRKPCTYRWRLNETLLQKEAIVDDCKKKLK